MHKILAFIVFISFSTVVFSDVAGQILFAQNEVTVKTKFSFGNGHPVSRGSSFNVGETIITGPKSKAQLKYTNGTLVTLLEDSSYRVVSYDPDNADNQSEAYLSQGKIESSTQNQEKAVLKTPVVALAILGTKFSASYNPQTQTASVDVQSGMLQALPNGIMIGAGSTTNATFATFTKGDAPTDSNTPSPLSSLSEVTQISEQQAITSSVIASTAPEAVAILSCGP